MDCTGNDRKESENSDQNEVEKDPLDIRQSPRKKAVAKGNLLKKMQSIFNTEGKSIFLIFPVFSTLL